MMTNRIDITPDSGNPACDTSTVIAPASSATAVTAAEAGKITGKQLATLLVAYALAVDEFMVAAYNPLSFGYSEAETLDELEHRLFALVLGRNPTPDEQQALNPLLDANGRLARLVMDDAERKGYERLFHKPWPLTPEQEARRYFPFCSAPAAETTTAAASSETPGDERKD
jgi:hypothetical protein